LSDSEPPHCDDSSQIALAGRYYIATSGSPSALIAALDAQLNASGWSRVRGRGDHVFDRHDHGAHLWAEVNLYEGNTVDISLNDGSTPY
jgi:hypothetical protein